jgi:hypothetical protein
MNASFSEQIAEIQVLIRNQQEKLYQEQQQATSRDFN